MYVDTSARYAGRGHHTVALQLHLQNCSDDGGCWVRRQFGLIRAVYVQTAAYKGLVFVLISIGF